MIKIMKNIILITTFYLILFFNLEQYTFATDDDHDFDSKIPMSIEEVYEVQGYLKGIDKKVKEFENKYDAVVKLPEKMPFKVNKKFARIAEDDTLSLHFIGEDQKDLFQITINPNKPLEEETNYTLDNGKKVYFEVIHPSNMSGIMQLYIKIEKFEYILGMKINEKYNKETLINVTESIN
ncbi:hypothetical protein CIL05_16450 [Virgibacillus profundi]|uniref:DUF4367 domain-containing protein n=1 Tax=Virgibacillus profundi TaxID=2024555 RepID=A0A2A2IB62_9BACI|nr:hypothetical protein [Virgibacillus profundi]PAV28524.1 hypothetical protein CIL05_16450 [Virgibacillus profundi]PXY52697.1 hypothetical protein CIT14_16595 [Virgibacillus profundi]